MTERDEPAPHSEPLILPGHIIWDSVKRGKVVGHGAGARSRSFDFSKSPRLPNPSAFPDSSRRGGTKSTPFRVPGRRASGRVGTRTWLEKSRRFTRRNGASHEKGPMSSRGQEPGRDDESPPRPDPLSMVCFAVCVCNDPSAGSPTETLLRLLLPLNDKV